MTETSKPAAPVGDRRDGQPEGDGQPRRDGQPEAADGATSQPETADAPDSPGVATIPVSGMTCAGCADNVQTALSQVGGVGHVEVDVDRGEARVRAAPGAAADLDEAQLRAAVERIGYQAVAPSPPTSEGSRSRRSAQVVIGVAMVGALALGVVAFQAVNAAYESAGALQQLNPLFGEVSLVAFGLALLLGLVVAFAPSSLAMAPAIIGYVSSSGTASTRRAAGLSGLFLAGMLLTNMVLGAVFALGGKAVMQAIGANAPVIYAIAAVLLVGMALILLGVWHPRLPSYRPRMLRPSGQGRAAGAFALGVPFGVMVCPACTPLLMPLGLGAAATADPLYGAALLGLFGLGRGVPMLVLGTFTGALQAGGTLARGAGMVQRVVGLVLLVAAGYFVVSALTFSGTL